MTRTNWDGTPADIAEIKVAGGGVLEVEHMERAHAVTLQYVGPRGGLSPVRYLTPDAAREMADALTRYAARAEEVEAR